MWMKIPEYILITGAPGSKWSFVAKSIYLSPDMNHSDSSKERTYRKMHIGAYFDPGMEFDNTPDMWDAPFDEGPGAKLIKSHTFAHELETLKDMGHPIILVVRPAAECYYWWKLAGGLDITYPNYKPYYKTYPDTWNEIVRQNNDIQEFIYRNNKYISRIDNNQALAEKLSISPEQMGLHRYTEEDIIVYLYKK